MQFSILTLRCLNSNKSSNLLLLNKRRQGQQYQYKRYNLFSTHKKEHTCIIKNEPKNKNNNNSNNTKNDTNQMTQETINVKEKNTAAFIAKDSMFHPSNNFMTKPIMFNSNLSTLCGHAAFIFMGAAYLTKDMFLLRTTAIGSITMSMIFQYYRPQPLIVPLRWNIVFLSINALMAAMLYQERKDAESMSDDLLFIYNDGDFIHRGFTKVDFYKLFSIAKKEKRKNMDYLKTQGSINDKMCYIVNGSARIVRNENDSGLTHTIGHVGNHDFTGEIDFMRYTRTKTRNDKGNIPVVVTSYGLNEGEENKEHQLKVEDDTDDINIPPSSLFDGKHDVPDHIATESIIIDSEEDVTVYVWDYQELKDYLAEHQCVSNSLFAYISHELIEKLEDAWEVKRQDNLEKGRLQQLAVNYLFGGIETKVSENGERQ